MWFNVFLLFLPYVVVQKLHSFYFLNNLVKNEPSLIIFRIHNSEEISHNWLNSKIDFCSFRRVIWLLSRCFKLLSFFIYCLLPLAILHACILQGDFLLCPTLILGSVFSDFEVFTGLETFLKPGKLLFAKIPSFGNNITWI